MTIGERLLKLRKERNLSQEELANKLDVSRQSISKWETDQSMPDFDKIVSLCEYFGITTDELLTGNKDIVEAKEIDTRSKFARNIAISVGLYIFSLVVLILFAAGFDQPIIGVCAFFTLIAIATGLIIYSSIMYGKKRKKENHENENSQVKLVTEAANLLLIVLYFIVSFLTSAWHITWVIFLIMAAVDTIIKILFDLKNDEVKNDVKEEITNEQNN